MSFKRWLLEMVGWLMFALLIGLSVASVMAQPKETCRDALDQLYEAELTLRNVHTTRAKNLDCNDVTPRDIFGDTYDGVYFSTSMYCSITPAEQLRHEADFLEDHEDAKQKFKHALNLVLGHCR